MRVSGLEVSWAKGTARVYWRVVEESRVELSSQKVAIIDVPFYERREIVHIAGHDGGGRGSRE